MNLHKHSIYTILFYFCIFLLILFFLGKIFIRLNDQPQSLSTKPINSLSFDDTVKYYYEPKENFDQQDSRDWLSNKPVYHFNNDSFKDRYNYSIEKAEGIYRIIILGDSNVEGKFVNTESSFPEQLEDLLNLKQCQNIKKFEVLNMGVSGYDIQYSLERYKRRGMKYHPDLVLWYISGPSFHKILEKIAPKITEYRKQMEISGELKQQEAKGDYYPFETKAEKELYAQYSEAERNNFQLAILKKFREIYQGNLIFLTVGHLNPELFPEELSMNLDQRYKDILTEFSQKNSQTYFHSNLPTLEEEGQRLLDLHPNAEGYRLFSESIYKYLNTNHFIDCT